MIAICAMATHGTILQHDGAGVAMRDAWNAARREDRQRIERQAAAAVAANEAAPVIELEADRKAVGGSRYANALEPMPALMRKRAVYRYARCKESVWMIWQINGFSVSPRRP